MVANHAVDGLPTLVVGHLGDGASVDKNQVGMLAFGCCLHAKLLQRLSES